jgi:hypothetical protein
LEQVPAVNLNFLFWKSANNENMRNHYFKNKMIFLIYVFVPKREAATSASAIAGLEVRNARTATQMATMRVVVDWNEDDGSSADADAGTMRPRPRSTDWNCLSHQASEKSTSRSPPALDLGSGKRKGDRDGRCR